jgi:TetR/AcrR family transcriptional regulator
VASSSGAIAVNAPKQTPRNTMKTPPEDLADKLYTLSEEFLTDSGEFSIDDIANTIGVPRATLYYYFSGRDDLLSFLMTEKSERMGVTLEKAMAEGGTVTERLERVIAAMVASMAQAPSLCVNSIVAMGKGPAMASLMRSSEQRVYGPLRELLIEGRATGELSVEDLDTACASMGGAVLMSCMRMLTMTGSIDADVIVPTLTTQLVDGLRSR